MVRLYFTEIKKDEEKNKEYIDVSIWSFLKTFVLTYLLFNAIIFGVFFLIGLFVTS